MAKLTEKILKKRGFILDRKGNKDEDLDALWYKDGITIYQNLWSENFSFATRTTEDGEFKSGYSVDTEERLEELFKGITGQKL